MAANKILLDTGTSATDSTSSPSDPEKAMPRKMDEGAPGVHDVDHEEVEADEINKEYLNDLERRHSTTSIKVSPQRPDEIHRTATIASARSIKSRLSRIATNLTNRSVRERLAPEPIPLMDLDKGIVGWESQNDPAMPLNFPDKTKWLLISLLASITFISPLASSMFAPGVSFMDKEFHNDSKMLSSLTVSIFVLGYVVGPMILAPLCEIYGRRIVLCGANVFFCIWQIGCALAPNIGTIIVFRFLAGIGGSGCLTIGGGVISDLFQPDRRGVASSIYSLGPLFGPVIGPICGGFLAQRAGWRWVFWILLISGSLVTIIIECFNQETNHRVLIQRKVVRLSKELGRTDLLSCYTPPSGPQTPTQILKAGLIRPIKMLFLSPIVFLLSLYMAVIYGLLYLLFTTITSVFIRTYAWEPELCGLAYIGLGLGFFVGIIVVGKISDPTVVRMTRQNNGIFEPEMRLPACIFFAFFIPVTFFWYGWSAEKGVHYIVPIIGLIPFGFGMMGVFIPIQTYTIDSFPEFAASAIAALTVSRSLFGAFLPLAGPDMYESLGLGWGNTVLGFIAAALIPAPMLIFRFGKRIRKRFPLQL